MGNTVPILSGKHGIYDEKSGTIGDKDDAGNQALREELASVERRAEEERAAHNATKLSRLLWEEKWNWSIEQLSHLQPLRGYR
ncbi:hypothetical protein A2U01_0039241 [Trifolium medium]|uniref:Uncharacterized protein n=1 Tax=Trifolium medium TaxID=97028 RepID=A0A392Q2Y5_9FABA|nr:hypothetical protein [Trifolium medium]